MARGNPQRGTDEAQEMLTAEERHARRARLRNATAAAKNVLKKGDRITVKKCPGTKRWIIFDHWEGDEIISASGQGEYAATSISRLNGESASFTA